MLSSLKICASYPFFSIIHIPLSIEHSIHHSISSFCLKVSSLHFTLITTFFNFISSVHPITPLWPQVLRFYHLDLTVLSSFEVSGSHSLHVKFQAVIHKRQGAKGAATLPALEEFAKISHNRAGNQPKVGQNFRKQWIFYRAASDRAANGSFIGQIQKNLRLSQVVVLDD